MLGTCVAPMRRFLQTQPPVGTPQKILAVNRLEEIYRESTEALEERRKLYGLGGKLPGSAKGKVGDQELNALLNDINRGCFIGKKIKNMVVSINDYIKIDALLFELHEHVYDSYL